MKIRRPNSSTCSSTKFEQIELPANYVCTVDVAFGNMTQWKLSLYHPRDEENFPTSLVLVIPSKNISGEFFLHQYVTKKDVDRILFKNKCDHKGDLGNIADFLNSQLGIEGDLQGYYYDNLCRNGIEDNGY